MTPDLLLKHFHRIADAPDAIPRLRRFILDLAVRGKLVEQDPKDEPASELLKRIQAEKARLVNKGKIKDSKPLSATDTKKVLYKIPGNWAWVPLGETVNSHLGGGTPSKNNSTYWDGDILWASVKDVGKGKYIDGTIDRITEAGLADSSSNFIPPGNLIVVTRMGLGKVSINRVPIAINQDLRALSLSSLVTIDYLYSFFKTHGFEGTGLTVKGIRVEELLNIAFPLPPLAEQHRIVAKVDELMALCDRLEAAQVERESRRDRLVASSLHLLRQNTDADAFREHARFHLDHLPSLATRPEHISQLRQVILDLAVRGKLVPQDPNDEPASELLNQIQVEKARLVKVGDIKKEKSSEATQADMELFDIPENWKWTQLGELTELITKGSSPRWQGVAYVSRDEGVLFVTSENVGKYHLRKMDAPKYVEKRFNEIEPRSVLRFGDILMNLVGASIGRTAVYKLHDAANINQAVALIRLVKNTPDLCSAFLLHYFNSPAAVQLMLASRVVTAQPNMSLTDAREFPLPIPPLAEQQRIVTRVEELMALCDQIEGRLNTARTESHRLLEAVLHESLIKAA